MVTNEEENTGSQVHLGKISRELSEEGNDEDLEDSPRYFLLFYRWQSSAKAPLDCSYSF